MARKRPRSFCQKCRWQVTPKYAYTLDPSKSEWAEYAAVQAECGNLSGNELIRGTSGHTRSQWSQSAEPLWTDPGPKSGISLRELISTLKKKKKAQAGNDLSYILPKSLHAKKKPPHHTSARCQTRPLRYTSPRCQTRPLRYTSPRCQTRPLRYTSPRCQARPLRYTSPRCQTRPLRYTSPGWQSA